MDSQWQIHLALSLSLVMCAPLCSVKGFLQCPKPPLCSLAGALLIYTHVYSLLGEGIKRTSCQATGFYEASCQPSIQVLFTHL